MIKGEPVIVYGASFTKEEIEERESWHERTYLEVEIPTELENEINEFIDKKVSQYQSKCGCGYCKLNANRGK